MITHRPWMASLIAAVLGLGISLAYAAGYKNLQVLPKTIEKKDLKAIMKAQSKALGVDCEYCHEEPNMASDEHPEKKVSRDMMRLVEAIKAGKAATKPAGGKKVVEAWEFYNKKLAPKTDVDCMTCHQGHEKPPK